MASWMTKAGSSKGWRAHILAASLSLTLCCAATGCSDGYPTEDLVDGFTMDGSERVARLNEVLANTVKSHADQLILANRCLLRVIWDPASQTVDYPLMHLMLTVKSDPSTGETDLLIQQSRAAGPAPLVLFTTDDWVDLATFRSQMNQLRASCADSQTQLPG